MPTRKYEQRLRAEAADETRRRILDALYERLRERPAEPASVDEIARLARVSRSTIYLIFGSRAGLFDALANDLFESGEFARVVEAIAQPDAREHLRGGVEGGTRMFAAHRDVFRVLYSMAAARRERRRAARCSGWRPPAPAGMARARAAPGRPGPAPPGRDERAGRRRALAARAASTPSTCSTPGAGFRSRRSSSVLTTHARAQPLPLSGTAPRRRRAARARSDAKRRRGPRWARWARRSAWSTG